MKHTIKITVNGILHTVVDVGSNQTLLDVLRERLGLIGTKRGCDSGECGACTVLLDGESVNSCLVLAVDANNKSIQTIEGLSENEQIHPIQEAFIEEGAIQCGFCTPGMIMSTKYLLDKKSVPDEEQIKKGLEGNLCRCTGYTKIVKAVKSAAKKINKNK